MVNLAPPLRARKTRRATKRQNNKQRRADEATLKLNNNLIPRYNTMAGTKEGGANRELARKAGAMGGRISKRGKAKLA